MRTLALPVTLLALFAGAAAAIAQEVPSFPAPVKEHEWLKQLVGEWDIENEAHMPDAPPMKCKGTEKVAQLGGFWIVSELNSEMMGEPMKAMLTIGYDPEKKKYVGTWVDSMTHYLWVYEGSVDETGKILTLEAEGPDMMNPGSGKTAKYRDVTEFKSPDERVSTSSVQGPDGKWVTFMNGKSTRKK